jgi:predicted transcriptional regulator
MQKQQKPDTSPMVRLDIDLHLALSALSRKHGSSIQHEANKAIRQALSRRTITLETVEHK